MARQKGRLPLGTVVRVLNHDGVARVIRHGRDKGGVWTGVEFDYEEVDGRKPEYQKFHRAALVPVMVHLVQFSRRFREAARAVDEREGLGHTPLPFVTRCGLKTLGPGETAMYRDHIEMYDGRPDKPVVTCHACLFQESTEQAVFDGIVERFKQK